MIADINQRARKLFHEDEAELGSNMISRQAFEWAMANGAFGLRRLGVHRLDASEAMRLAGVPEVVIAVLEGGEFDPDKVPKSARGWVEEYNGKKTSGLWLNGASGAGKTTTASWILRELMERRPCEQGAFVFIAVSDLVRETWMGASFYGESNKWQRLRPFETCGLLVLDDLGSCTQGREECAVVREVVDKRWQGMLPTIFTTQYGLREYCDCLESAGANKHDTAPLAQRILASLSGYVGTDATLIERHRIRL